MELATLRFLGRQSIGDLDLYLANLTKTFNLLKTKIFRVRFIIRKQQLVYFFKYIDYTHHYTLYTLYYTKVYRHSKQLYLAFPKGIYWCYENHTFHSPKKNILETYLFVFVYLYATSEFQKLFKFKGQSNGIYRNFIELIKDNKKHPPILLGRYRVQSYKASKSS